MNLLVSLIALAALLATFMAAWANGFASPAARRQVHYNAQGKLSLVGRTRLALTALFVRFSPAPEGNLILANVGEGQSLNGLKTYLSDVATTFRYLLGKIGSDSAHVTTTAAADKPHFVIIDNATAIGDPVTCAVLGSAPGTQKVSINSTVTLDDPLTPDANGYARTMPTANGTYWLIGRALQAGVAGDIIEFAPCSPRQITYLSAVPTSGL